MQLIQEIANWFTNFIAVFRTFEIKDVIDILFITLIIFALFKFVKETRAEQLLKGILIFIAVYMFSNLLGLVMLTALLKNFFQYGVIILFLIFQPEVRKALEQIGRSKFASFRFGQASDMKNSHYVTRKAISDVVDAAAVFQTTKVGALFVFERGTNLKEIVDTGVIVDAETSVSLFGNIFFNKAPLHDGAVIISSGRILAASCILPLTQKTNIDPSLGTRHRAAIGISEETDAVAVVVSEETGQISVAYKGALTRDYKRDTLFDVLEDLLITEEKVDLLPIFSKKRKEKNDE